MAPDETKPDRTISIIQHNIGQQQKKKAASMPRYHIMALELRWKEDCNIIPGYPIQVFGTKGVDADSVTVKDRSGLEELIKDVKHGRYAKYLREIPLEDDVNIREGLGPWEPEWSDFFDEGEESGNEDEDKDVHVDTHIFIQVDVANAPGSTVVDDDFDTVMDVEEEVGKVKPCAGRQYAWRAEIAH